MAAGDLYEKIKMIQNKLLVSPDETHLLTIASDCENCWENYQNDGRDFLENIYSMIENDETLETVLISDYIREDKHKKSLKKIFSGSWIDKTFQFWIGEPEKNKAWAYLKKTRMISITMLKKTAPILILIRQNANYLLQKAVTGSGGTENQITQVRTLFLTTCSENV